MVYLYEKAKWEKIKEIDLRIKNYKEKLKTEKDFKKMKILKNKINIEEIKKRNTRLNE